MKCIFEATDRYLQKSDWRDIALIKFCVCAVGILMGMSIPRRSRKPIGVIALIIFVATYVPLMIKFIGSFKCGDLEQTIEID